MLHLSQYTIEEVNWLVILAYNSTQLFIRVIIIFCEFSLPVWKIQQVFIRKNTLKQYKAQLYPFVPGYFYTFGSTQMGIFVIGFNSFENIDHMFL